MLAEIERAQHVGSLFERRCGRTPRGVWAAPGRVNLIGEHTDYNEGFVLPLALAQRAYVAAAAREDGLLRVISEQLGELVLPADSLRPEADAGWAAYAAGAVWALQRHAAAAGVSWLGVDLVIDSDVPVGAGLSSSAAIECAVALAVAALHKLDIKPSVLADIAFTAETQFVGVPCGRMDQTISACAQAGHALLIDCRSLELEPVPISWNEAGLELMVIDTRAPHRLVDGEYAKRRATCESAAVQLGAGSLRDVSHEQLEAKRSSLQPEQYLRARHVISENQRVMDAVRALKAADFVEFGRRMTASHASLRDDFQVTVPELDVAVDAALGAGALGARMTGGGFGGCVLALSPERDRVRLQDAVSQSFARSGFASPEFLVAHASHGAGAVTNQTTGGT